MKERAPQPQRDKQEWQRLVEEYHGSGLSKTAFCRLKGVNRSYFHLWFKCFAGAQGESKPTAGSASQFIPLSLMTSTPGELHTDTDSAAAAPANMLQAQLCSPFHLQYPSGLRLSFEQGCALSELQSILEMFRAL